MKELPTFHPGRRSADPNRTSLIVGGVVAAAGMVTLLATWWIVGNETEVWKQIPYLVSGGLAGIAIVASGLAVVNIQTTRRLSALRRRRMDTAIDRATDLAGRLHGRGEGSLD